MSAIRWAGTCSIPTGTAVLSIGANPIIQAVTSSSSLLQVSLLPSVQSVVAYDMVSVFRETSILVEHGLQQQRGPLGNPDAVTYTYSTSLSPDATGPTQRLFSVAFLVHRASTLLGNAPILFATNDQINLMVPGGIAAQIGNQVDVVVSFGYGSGATLRAVLPSVGVVATNPGIFTIGADGQGDVAVDSDYSLISADNPGRHALYGSRFRYSAAIYDRSRRAG